MQNKIFEIKDLRFFNPDQDYLLFPDGKIYPSTRKNHDWNIIEIAEQYYPKLFKDILEYTECSSYKEIEEGYKGQLVMGYSFSCNHKILRYISKYNIFNTSDFPITQKQYDTLKILADEYKYISKLEYEKAGVE